MVDSNTRLDTTYAMQEYRNPKFDGKIDGLNITPARHSDWNRKKDDNFILYDVISLDFIYNIDIPK